MVMLFFKLNGFVILIVWFFLNFMKFLIRLLKMINWRGIVVLCVIVEKVLIIISKMFILLLKRN